MYRVLAVGDANVDFILTGLPSLPKFEQEVLAQGFETFVGGQTATFARALSSLGGTVTFVGKVGDDAYGRKVIEQLRQDGVDPSGVVVDPSLRTGVTVVLSTGGGRGFVTFLGSISEVHREDICYSYLQAADHIHVGSYFLQTNLQPDLTSLFKQAHDLGLTTSLDVGWDPSEGWDGCILNVLKHVDIFLPNEVEAAHITKATSLEVVLEMLGQYAHIVVIKRGEKGCLVRKGLHQVDSPAFAVPVVDVTSAGDVFNAGFIYAFLSGWDLDKAAEFANACGAIAVTKVGSSGIISGLQEVEEFLISHHNRSE